MKLNILSKIKNNTMTEIILTEKSNEILKIYHSEIIPNIGDEIVIDSSSNSFIVERRMLPSSENKKIVLIGKII